MKKILILLTFFGVVFGLSLLFTKRYLSQKNSNPADSNKVQVTASFYPLYFFATEIGGQYVSVTNLTPAGSEPHDYELSPKQVAQIQTSQLLIMNGEGFETWAEKIKENLEGKSTRVISFESQFIDHDPHIWLSPILALSQVERISLELQVIDPSHASTFKQNEQTLKMKLVTLDTEFQQGLQNCKQQNIITSHAAFGYLANAYTLKQIPISGLSPDEEPSAAKLAEIAEFVKQNQITTIFFEALVSPKLAETIARETGARTAVLNPLEGLTDEELQSGQDYFSIQRQNLATLRTALQCQ